MFTVSWTEVQQSCSEKLYLLMTLVMTVSFRTMFHIFVCLSLFLFVYLNCELTVLVVKCHLANDGSLLLSLPKVRLLRNEKREGTIWQCCLTCITIVTNILWKQSLYFNIRSNSVPCPWCRCSNCNCFDILRQSLWMQRWLAWTFTAESGWGNYIQHRITLRHIKFVW